MADSRGGLAGIWQQMRRERKPPPAPLVQVRVTGSATAQLEALMDEIADQGTARIQAETRECSRCGAVVVRDETGWWVVQAGYAQGRGVCQANDAGPWLPHQPQRAEAVPAAEPEVSGEAEPMTQAEVWRQVEQEQARLQGFTASEGAEPAAEPEEETLPDGVIGYLVAFAPAGDASAPGTTHTTLMSRGEAGREARGHRGLYPGQRWFPVEVREAPRD